MVASYSNVAEQDVVEDNQDETDEVPELEAQENAEIQTESDIIIADDVEEDAKEEKEEINYASKYDFFKKKNIDVDKIMSSGSKSSSSALPYINVDSDYVVKGDETAVSKTINNLENGSELLGSMMQDMGSIKKLKKEEEQKAEAEKVEVDESNSEESKTEEVKQEDKGETEEKKVENDDPFAKFGQFEVAENAQAQVVEEENGLEKEDSAEPAEESKEETVEQISQEPEIVETKEEVQESADDEEIKLEIPAVEPIEIEKPEVVEPEIEVPQDDISQERRESIASVVGGFKTKSKLASGGVIIERNQPISKREKSSSYSNNDYGSGAESYDGGKFKSNGITHLSVQNNTDNILNTFRSSAGGYDDYQNYGASMQNPMFGAGYSAPQYDSQGFGYNQSGFGQSPMMGDYGMQSVPNYQNTQAQGFDNYADSVSDYEDFDYEEADNDYEEVVEPVKKPAVKRTKENEPRPRNLKKKESEPVMEEVKGSKRGRPKKQVFDETVTIKNDKEFDEVLSRAEKLMKKSESGLSASQSKRIEKELKMLMDAMNKYKEGE